MGNPIVKVYGHVRSGNHLLARLMQQTFYPGMVSSEVPEDAATGHWSRRREYADYKVDGESTRHIPYTGLLGHHFKPGEAKITLPAVYVFRDGRGVARSCHAWTKFRHMDLDSITLEEYLHTPLDWSGTPGRKVAAGEESILQHWHRHIASWVATYGGNRNVLFVRYEDLVDDPKGEMQRISNHFGLEEKGQPDASESVGWNTPASPNPMGWRDDFTPDMLTLFDAMIPQDFRARGEFKGEPLVPERAKDTSTSREVRATQRLGFVATAGRHFIQPFVDHLSDSYPVIYPSSAGEFNSLELLFFEWANEALVDTLRVWEKTCPVVVRLHSYEALAGYPARVDWSKVDVLIFVAEHVKDYCLERYNIVGPEILVIPNLLDFDQFPLVVDPEKRPKKVAWAGALQQKKGPLLFAQCIGALLDSDPEFEFHLLQSQQDDPRFSRYLHKFLERNGMESSVVFHDRLKPCDMPGFFAGMGYVVSTSPWESFQSQLAEGIASGCLPLIHTWEGAEAIYGPHAEYFDGAPEFADKLLSHQRKPVTVIRDHLEGAHGRRKVLGEMSSVIRRVLGDADPACAPPRITACMIVKNEGQNLGRCLASIKGAVDDIVVVDTGSTDTTVAIAEAHGARVFHHPWEEDFSLHRNQAFAYADDADWWLILDGDELMENAQRLRQTVNQIHTREDVDAVKVSVYTVTTSNAQGVHYDLVRCIRAGSGRGYALPVHNQLVGCKSAVTAPDDLRIRSMYLGSQDGKVGRSLPMLLKLWAVAEEDYPALWAKYGLDAKPDGLATPKAHAARYLTQTYSQAQDWENVVLWAERAVEIMDVDRFPSYFFIFEMWVTALRRLGKPEAEVNMRLEEGLAMYPDCPRLLAIKLRSVSLAWAEAASGDAGLKYPSGRNPTAMDRLPDALHLLGL